ncbi:hypothetical protein [Blastococcus sp. CT_GayMR16]|uniref:hypothetical protein n=1 Tax=Blastococcus sp. CT_GayMR16 TaxID=2559607 RepID=UPI0010749ABD|nr:hypothetical protein [Blastococcus sp. CT_GayMR16]TFV83164.1 hypothetical protein E4P38_21140 [Blastococcus sp. CT_GayMR16]
MPRLTGVVDLADPMFSRGIEDGGVDAEFVTTPRRTVIWPMRDNRPVGCFLVWARPGYRAGNPVMTVQADRIDSLLAARTVRATLQFSQVDQLGIARDLIRYALGRPLLHALEQPLSKGPAADVPWLRLDPAVSGVLRDRLELDGYQALSRKKISELLAELAAVQGGFEQRLDYAIDPVTNAPFATWRFGYPTLGVSAADTQLVFEHPGVVEDLVLDEDAYTSANLVDVLGAGEGESKIIATALDTRETDTGGPLLEYTHTGDETQLENAFAKASAQLADRLGVNEGWTLRVRADAEPAFGSYVLGDHIVARVSDTRWPLREVLLRVIGWDIHPSTSSVDTVDLVVTNP